MNVQNRMNDLIRVGDPVDELPLNVHCRRVRYESLPPHLRPPGVSFYASTRADDVTGAPIAYAIHGFVPTGTTGWQPAVSVPPVTEWLAVLEDEMRFTHQARLDLLWHLHPTATARVVLLEAHLTESADFCMCADCTDNDMDAHKSAEVAKKRMPGAVVTQVDNHLIVSHLPVEDAPLRHPTGRLLRLTLVLHMSGGTGIVLDRQVDVAIYDFEYERFASMRRTLAAYPGFRGGMVTLMCGMVPPPEPVVDVVSTNE